MTDLTPQDVDLRLTELRNENSEDHDLIRLNLEDEKISRIAGDAANNNLINQVKAANTGTESRLSTEVIHRSEGDLSNLGNLNALSQAMSDYRIKTDLELTQEAIARQQLGVDLQSSVSSISASFNQREHQLRTLIQLLNNDLDAKYLSMDSRIGKYEDMLQDITTDSIQITMDNGDINMGAWTILSQARQWDLDILNSFKGYKDSVTEDLNQALEDLQNKLPIEQDIIDKAIEQLSNADVIKDLDDLLKGSLDDINTVSTNLSNEIQNRQDSMVAQANKTANDIRISSEALADSIAAESQERINAIQREAQIRQEQLLQEAADRTAEIDDKLVDINSALTQEQLDRLAAIALLEDGLTEEIQHRKDGDTSSINAINNYKTSNDGALANIRTDLDANVSATAANTQSITSLDASMQDVNDLAASAVTKANAAVTATEAQAIQIDQVKADLTGLGDTVGQKADSSALTLLDSKVTSVDGRVSSNSSSITSLNDRMTITENSVALKADSNVVADLSSKVTNHDDRLTVQTNSILGLEGRVLNVEGGLANKADASVLNNYYTSTATDEAIAGQLTTFKAGLAIGGDNLLTNTKTFNKAGTVELSKSTLRPSYAGFGTAFVTHPDSMLWRTHTVMQVRSDWCGFYYSCNSDNPADWIADQDMTLSVWVKNISNADVYAHGIATALGHVATISSGEWQRIVMHIPKGSALRNTANQGIIEFHFTSTEGAFYYAAPMLQYGNVATAWQPAATDSEFDTTQFASAAYVQSIEANVNNIEGSVTANAANISNMSVRLDNTQADLVNNYYTKTEANEATSGQLITMRSQLAYGARNFVRNTGAAYAGWSWLFQQPLTTKLQGEVTISFDVEVISVGGNTGAGVGFNMGDAGTSGYRYDWYPEFTQSGHFSHTLTVDSENFTHFGIYANNEVRITKVMVQLGNVEFPWSPAPEDLSSAVSANATAIQNTYTKAEANTATAGQIATFEASLALGGGILDVGRSKAIHTFEFGTGTITVTDRKSNNFKIDVTNNGLVSAYISLATNSEKLPIGTPYVFTGKVRTSRAGAVDLIYSRVNQFTSDSYIYGAVGTEWQTFTTKGVTNTSEGDPIHSLIGAKMPAAVAGDWVEFKDCRVSVNTDEMTIANANSIQAVVNEVSELDGNLQVLSQKTEKFSASIANAKLPTIVNEDRVNQWHLTVVVPHKTVGGAPTYEHLDGATVVDERYVYDDATMMSIHQNSIFYFRAVVYCDTERTIVGSLLGDDSHAVYVDGVKVFEAGYNSTHDISFSLPYGLSTIDIIVADWGGLAGFTLTPLLSSQVTWLKAVKSQGKDNADAISSIGASLTKLDGRVTANANQTTNLQVKLDQRKIYRLYSGGAEAATGGAGFIQGFSPDSMQYIGRSYGLVVFAGDGSIQSVNTYDVYGGHTQPFIDAVAAVPIGTWVAVITTDEPLNNSALIIDALKSLGGTDAVKQTVYRSAYLLVGRKGLSEGSAIELVSSKPSMGCTYMLEMFNGVPTSLGGSSPQAGIISQMRSEVTALNGNITSISETVTRHTASLSVVAQGTYSKTHVLDLRGLDENLYYPVVMTLATAPSSKLRVLRTLGSFPDRPSWSTHGAGFDCKLEWVATGDGWGTTSRDLTIVANDYRFAQAVPFLGLGQITESSLELIYLRGGAQYYLDTSSSASDPRIVTTAEIHHGRTLAPMTYTDSYIVSAPDLKLKASADALSQTQAQVTNIDGRLTTTSSTVNQLQTDVGDHSSRLVVQGNSIDGIKAEYFVKTDVNGLVAGYGLVNSGSTSAFGVAAEYFYVGSPSANKKPFMVLSSSQTIGGVTYPAGTWIDVALIANATIGTAHIADASIVDAKIANLNASKITAGIISADRIGANSISAEKLMVGDATNLWGNQHFTQVNPYPNSSNNRTRWVTDVAELKGNGIQMWGRDHYAPYSTKIPLKAGDTFVIEYIAGRNGGPDIPLNVGLWTYNINGNGGNSPWQMGPAEQIANLGSGWFRWRRIFVVTNAGHTLPVAYGVLYFMIEQAADEPSPAYWTVGDVTVRKGVGGELIVNGSVTADKIQVANLSAVSANLGTFTSWENADNTGARTVIEGKGMKVYYPNGNIAIKIGL